MSPAKSRWAEIVAEAEKRYGRIDILCNIAGISGRDPRQNIQSGLIGGGRIGDQTLEQWNKVLEINATGTFLGVKAVIPAMQRAGGGSIINISSICGIVGSHSNAAYHASKGAVRIFSKAAAIQYAPDQIRVNSIHPGFVDTPMTKPGHSNPEVAQVRLDATPLGRFGTPADIAAGLPLSRLGRRRLGHRQRTRHRRRHDGELTAGLHGRQLDQGALPTARSLSTVRRETEETQGAPMFIRSVERDTTLDAFRAEVRAFCEKELPAEVRRKQALGQHLERHEYDAWLKRLGTKGWVTGKWPKEHGGLGWSPAQYLAFSRGTGPRRRTATGPVRRQHGGAGHLHLRQREA